MVLSNWNCWSAAAACAVYAGMCGCHPIVAPSERPAGESIALEVLPGEWEVVGEAVVFTFDEAGMPVTIRNEADPEDFRTNVQFGGATHLSAPIGGLDVTLRPEMPYIDAVTGEAWFTARADGSNIMFLGAAIPGSGHALYAFSGRYDAETGELSGESHIEVWYGKLLIYVDDVDRYVLTKRQ